MAHYGLDHHKKKKIFLTLYMYIGGINFIFLCIKCLLEDGSLSLTRVGKFIRIDNL